LETELAPPQAGKKETATNFYYKYGESLRIRAGGGEKGAWKLISIFQKEKVIDRHFRKGKISSMITYEDKIQLVGQISTRILMTLFPSSSQVIPLRNV